MLKGGMGRENRVVRLNDRVRHGWCRVHAELELRLLAIVGRQTLKNESTETGTSSATKRVEDKEALKAIAVVCKATDLIHDGVNHFLSDGVVATSICKAPHVSNETRRDGYYAQLLAASSLPVTRVSGWNRLR